MLPCKNKISFLKCCKGTLRGKSWYSKSVSVWQGSDVPRVEEAATPRPSFLGSLKTKTCLLKTIFTNFGKWIQLLDLPTYVLGTQNEINLSGGFIFIKEVFSPVEVRHIWDESERVDNLFKTVLAVYKTSLPLNM